MSATLYYKIWVRNIVAVIGLAFFCVLSTNLSTAYAAQTTPFLLNFQGKLADASGAPLADGQYNIIFRAYLNAPTGGSSTWSESRTGANRVTVKNGIFSTQLGVLSPFASSDFTNYDFYIETELPTPATATCDGVGCSPVWSEGPLSPRQPIASNAYAMNTDLVDGIDGASLAQLSANQSFTGNNTFTGTFLLQPASDSTTAFQIKNNAGAALLVADTTSNFALKVGGGDVSPDASPALLVLDYKSTSGDPTGVDGAMYYNGNSGKFRCRENGTWKDCLGGTRTRVEMHQDFIFSSNFALGDGTNLADGALGFRLGGNGGSFARQAGELGHPGILRFQAGNFFVSSNLAATTSTLDTTNQMLFGGGLWVSNIMLRIPSGNLSSAGETYTAYNGFMDGITTTNIAPANGCYLKYSHGINSGKWQGVCRNAGNETGSTCDTGVTVAVTNWYNLTTTVNAAATSVTFAVYDTTAGTTSTCTVTTNIPTANRVSYGMGLTRSAGSTNRAIDYDYVEYIGEGLSR